jgi:hypothetical protein
MDEPPKPDVWIVDTTSRIRSSPAMAAFGILSYVPNGAGPDVSPNPGGSDIMVLQTRCQ